MRADSIRLLDQRTPSPAESLLGSRQVVDAAHDLYSGIPPPDKPYEIEGFNRVHRMQIMEMQQGNRTRTCALPDVPPVRDRLSVPDYAGRGEITDRAGKRDGERTDSGPAEFSRESSHRRFDTAPLLADPGEHMQDGGRAITASHVGLTPRCQNTKHGS
jgi:hypothetical protein